ncbi:MAG: hypothetical protein K2Q23_03340 [Bryobacteraceae bacterium]|nr:hypothetical protein [Bryobacteraceae bacterium]
MKPHNIFLIFAAVLLSGLAAYLTFTSRSSTPALTPQSPPAALPVAAPSAGVATVKTGSSSTPAPPAPPSAPSPAKPAPNSPDFAAQRLLFRHNAIDARYGRLAFLDAPFTGERQFAGDLVCEAVHFARGRGICLTAERGVFTTYSAVIFDSEFRRLFTIPLAGAPSRCRVAPNGKLAAATVFRSGHSYSSADFTTQTLLIDTTTGQVLLDLEKLQVQKDGRPFSAPDFNFWGVTFTPDSRSFYCTVSSNRQHYLLSADLASRSARVLRANVECPSLSPDGKRIAYKKRMPGSDGVKWAVHLLDLASSADLRLRETRSVDDQMEWLDHKSILYALTDETAGNSGITHVWRMDVDASLAPLRLVSTAYSPAAVR